jgi:hypothetical protein
MQQAEYAMNRTMFSPQRIFAVLCVVFGLLLCATGAPAQDRPAPNPKQSLRVLYVSGKSVGFDPGEYSEEAWARAGARDAWRYEVGARIADFVQFLQENFSSVRTCKDDDFTPEKAKDADVIIVDGDISERLPASFPVPMILIGLNADPIKITESKGWKLKFV